MLPADRTGRQGALARGVFHIELSWRYLVKHLFRVGAAITAFVSIDSIANQKSVHAAPWVTAYYPTWTLTSPTPSNIDMRAITHLVFFALTPTTTGTLTDTGGTVAANAAAVRTAAHNAGKKVLICIGGGGTEPQFVGAISAANRATFVANIVNWVQTNGYDGVDIDMEPMASADGPNYQAFIQALRTALNNANSNLLLTAAVEPSGFPSIFAPIQSSFNQINVMSYDLSGNWAGWCSWHNSPLTNGGNFMPSTGNPMPSCTSAIQSYISAGIPASKLAIGTAFYGDRWTNVTGPMQALSGSVTVTAVSYADIMTNYYSAAAYRWDAASGAAYLTLPAQPSFISYDDPTLCAAKVNYAVNNGLGGLVCWNIGQQYIPSQPAGQQQPLLAAIYSALHPTVTTDTLSNLTGVSSRSANWTLDGSNPTYFKGDTSRATRTVDDTEYLVYSYPNITTSTAKVYAWNGPIGNVSFLVSTDNGATYTAVGVTTGSKTITTSPWGYYNITNAAPLPPGVTNLKVQFSATGQTWDPQLSQISITHR